MIWISAIVGAVCGILAAGIAAVMVKNRNENKRQYSIVFAVTMAILLAISQITITPKLKVRYAVRNLDQTLSVNPAFAAIKKYDSPTYTRMLADVKTALSEGMHETEIAAAMQSNILNIVQKRLPIASDDAAAVYMSVMVQEMVELQKHGPDTCYKFLFPQAGERIDISHYLPEAIINADQKH